MSFFRSFGRSKKESSKKVVVPPPLPQKICDPGDADTKPGASVDSVDGEPMELLSDADDLKRQLQQKLKELGVHAAEDLLEEALDTEKSWSTWHNSKGLKVEKTKTCLSKSISGRGAFTWTPKYPYDIKFIGDYLWDDKTKPQYDPATETMIPLMDIDENAHVVDQVFRGRFGFAGRDFAVVVNRSFIEDEHWERVVFGARSVSEEDLEQILSYLPADNQNKKEYESYKPKVVRGVAYLAGLIVSRNKSTGEFTVAYVNDADAKTVGVPRWVVDRVKADQLKIVGNVPGLVDRAWQIMQGETVADDEPALSSTFEVHSAMEEEEEDDDA